MTDFMLKTAWIGDVKFWMERLQSYASKLQFFMVCWLFIQTVPWHWAWTLGIVISVPLFLWLDIRYIAPVEFRHHTYQNPAWHEMMRAIKRLACYPRS